MSEDTQQDVVTGEAALFDMAMSAAQAAGKTEEESPIDEVPVEETAAEEPGAEAKKEEEEPKTSEEIRRKQRDLDKQYRELDKKQKKFQATKAKTLAELAEARKEREQFAKDTDALLRGDARAILATLGRMTGRDPIEVYRELTTALASDGAQRSKPAVAPEVEAINKQLTELTQRLAKKDEEAEQAKQRTESEARVRTELGSLVANKTDLPNLAEYAAAVGSDRAVQELYGAMLALYQRNEVVTTGTMAKMIEANLRGDPEWRTRLGIVKKTGADTPQAEPEKTEAGQSTQRGASLSPSVATTATRTRPLTEEERKREALKRIDGVMAEIGLAF